MNNSEKTCANKFAYRLLNHANGPIVESRRLFCNRWRCRYCAPKMGERLREQIIRESKKHHLDIALTLTLSAENRPSEAVAFRIIKDVWARFRTAMKSIYSEHFVYIWVLGITRSGQPHLHVLINQSFRQQQLSQIWERCGGGKVVCVKEVKNAVIQADYMACNILGPGFLRGTRRFGNSKHVKLSMKKLVGSWELVPQMNSLDSIAPPKRILCEKPDRDGKRVYCIVKRPYLHLREEE